MQKLIHCLKDLYLKLEGVPVLGYPLRRLRPAISSWFFDLFFPEQRQYWAHRIKIVRSSSDNDKIERVEDAGQIKDGYLIMHNGIKIDPSSYYGEGNRKLLQLNKGVHEPQEERVFQEVLKLMPEGAAMLELGAYWCFYSMWFARSVPGAVNVMVEPAAPNLAFGKRIFRSIIYKVRLFRVM